METHDGRKLTPEAQEVLRKRVVDAIVNHGMRQVDACKTFNVSKTSVHNWLTAYKKGGMAALDKKRHGRPPGSRLKGYQAGTIVRMITDRCPDQLKLPFALWTREAVADLINDRYGISISVWTAGRYLKKWGFTPQKPARRAYERNPKAVKKWLNEEYPDIRKEARKRGAAIHWGDEMGMRSDHQTGHTWGRKGVTPIVPATGKRFGCNMISTVTNQGHMSFMVFTKRFTADVFIEFLSRLMRNSKKSIFLIIDSHPVHRSAKVNRWVSKQNEKLTLFYLPGYSPELNPDELLNQDVKANALKRRRPHNRDEMLDDIRSYLRSTQRRPDIVRSYFLQKDVAYAG